MAAPSDDVRLKLQQQTSLSKKLESQLAYATAREKTSLETARALETKFKQNANALEKSQADLSSAQKLDALRRDLGERQQAIIESLNAEKTSLEAVNSDLRTKLSNTSETFSDIQGKLNAWDLEQKKVMEENGKLRESIAKISEYTRALERKGEAELKAKELELKMADSRLQQSQDQLRESLSHQVALATALKSTEESFKKSMATVEEMSAMARAAMTDAKSAKTSLALSEDNVKKLLQLQQMQASSLETEKAKVSKLSTLCKSLQGMMGAARAEAAHVKNACAQAGLEVPPMVLTASTASSDQNPATVAEASPTPVAGVSTIEPMGMDSGKAGGEMGSEAVPG